MVRVISELTELPPNWNGLGGRPVSVTDAANALEFLSRLDTSLAPRPFLYPSGEGGLVMEFRTDTRRLVVLLEGDTAMVGLLPDQLEPLHISLADEKGRGDLERSILAGLEKLAV